MSDICRILVIAVFAFGAFSLTGGMRWWVGYPIECLFWLAWFAYDGRWF